jgi:hypothetical protein
MLELQENIAKVQSATVALRRRLVEHATREYFATLDLAGSPTASDFEAAQTRANVVLRQELLSPDAAALINGGTKLSDDSLALLALSFEALAGPVRIPGPAPGARTKGLTLALAGAAGAVGGMFTLGALLRLAYDMRDLGLAVGGPLGAFFAVLVVYPLGRWRLLTRILPFFFTRPKALRGTVRSEHQKVVRALIEQWVDWAVPMLTILCLQQSAPEGPPTDRDKALRRIGKLVYALHRAPAESLPVVAHELIQEAKNSGFEGLEGQPAFLPAAPLRVGEADHAANEITTWRPDLRTRYETFGDIAEGDPVRIERPAVVFGGKVVQRGLVRKIRDRA